MLDQAFAPLGGGAYFETGGSSRVKNSVSLASLAFGDDGARRVWAQIPPGHRVWDIISHEIC
jgi:hypothetical protein